MHVESNDFLKSNSSCVYKSGANTDASFWRLRPRCSGVVAPSIFFGTKTKETLLRIPKEFFRFLKELYVQRISNMISFYPN